MSYFTMWHLFIPLASKCVFILLNTSLFIKATYMYYMFLTTDVHFVWAKIGIYVYS